MAKSKKPAAKSTSVPVKAHTHVADKRPNIPTRETAAFAADDATSVLYPRDPSLDPQLVWKGKDEQDRQPLQVPAVPIHAQEKIHPQAIIEEVRRRAGSRERPVQLDLFADFNGLDDFAKKLDFYKHTRASEPNAYRTSAITWFGTPSTKNRSSTVHSIWRVNSDSTKPITTQVLKRLMERTVRRPTWRSGGAGAGSPSTPAASPWPWRARA